MRNVNFEQADFVAVEAKGLRSPVFVQDNHDGTYTRWSYSAFGAFGSTGKPLPGVIVREVRKSERKDLERHVSILNSAIKSSERMYAVAKLSQEASRGLAH